MRLLISLLIAGSLAVAFCANPAIGVATAKGSFQIDKSKVYGNTTLFDGSFIETTEASSDLVLNTGARLRLAAGSQARVHTNRLVLEKGQGQVSGASGYFIEALSLRAAPDSPQSQMTVTYKGSAGIQVAALTGSARVSGPDGVMLAKVTPGAAIDLDPQAAGAAAPSKITGRLGDPNHFFILPDESSHISFELTGPTVEKFVHKCVEVTGTIDPTAKANEGAAHLIYVITIKEVSGCSPVAGMTWKSKALIGGIVVGATAATAGVVVATRKNDNVSRK